MNGTTTRTAPATQPQRRPLSEEQRRLAESVVGTARKLAHACARRLGLFGDDREEVLSEALSLAVLTAGRFDPARGVKFSTFAHQSMKLYFMHYAGRRRLRRREWLDTDRKACMSHGHWKMDTFGGGLDRCSNVEPSAPRCPVQAGIRHDMELLLGRMRGRLSEREYDVLLRHAGGGETYRSIGRSLGLSLQRVAAIAVQARRKMLASPEARDAAEVVRSHARVLAS